MSISVVIATLNDEDKIEKCLSSVSWADEKVVVDLNSTDRTREICQNLGAKVFEHERVPYVELVRNESIEKASGDWILILDPDEEIPAKLKEELLKIAKEGNFEAVLIPRKNFIFGKFIRHSAWWPDYLLRFFKKGMAQWGKEIHVDAKPQGRVLKLAVDPEMAIIHQAYSDLTSFLKRANRYSSIEAENKYQQGERYSFLGMSWAMLREFAKRFIKGMAFLDGMQGVVLTILQVYYQFLVYGKLWEMEKNQ